LLRDLRCLRCWRSCRTPGRSPRSDGAPLAMGARSRGAEPGHGKVAHCQHFSPLRSRTPPPCHPLFNWPLPAWPLWY
jgi:hypothetical protein